MKPEKIGAYAVHSEIGRGNFGVVYRCENGETGQQCAIKKINLSRIRSDNLDVQVMREVNLLRKMDHPHIMRLYEVLKSKKYLYLVCEMVYGGDLFDFLKANAPLEESRARRIFRQLKEAVSFCHQHGVSHRDLKPENVLLTRDGSIKLIDFGFSNLFRTDDEAEYDLKTACGTPNYVAPEVLRGAGYNGRAVDVWSMGVLLYEMCAGRLPFDHEDSDVLYDVIRRVDFHMCPDFSPELRAFVGRILVPDPSTRIKLVDFGLDEWYSRDELLWYDVREGESGEEEEGEDERDRIKTVPTNRLQAAERRAPHGPKP